MGIVTQTVKKNVVSTNVLKIGNAEYKLPTSPSVPIQILGGYTMLIYGAKKIGKTSLCSRFPNALFLMFEPGGKALSLYQEPMTSWKKFTRFVELLKKDNKFQTVVIDTADYAYEDCLTETCAELGIEHPSDAGWGKGWNAVKKAFGAQIRTLLKSGKGVIFISHQREEEIEERSGRKYNRKSNTLPGQARELLEGLVDIWANYDYDGKKRKLTILGDDFTDAGHRIESKFKYTNGDRIRKIDMGNSADEAYQNFMNAFNNKSIKPIETEGGQKSEKKVLPVLKSKLTK